MYVQRFLKDHIWKDFVAETKLGWTKCVISPVCQGHRSAKTRLHAFALLSDMGWVLEEEDTGDAGCRDEGLGSSI